MRILIDRDMKYVGDIEYIWEMYKIEIYIDYIGDKKITRYSLYSRYRNI